MKICGAKFGDDSRQINFAAKKKTFFETPKMSMRDALDEDVWRQHATTAVLWILRRWDPSPNEKYDSYAAVLVAMLKTKCSREDFVAQLQYMLAGMRTAPFTDKELQPIAAELLSIPRHIV